MEMTYGECCVSDACQGSVAGQFTDTEYVYAPSVHIGEDTGKFFFPYTFHTVSWQLFAGETVCVGQSALDA